MQATAQVFVAHITRLHGSSPVSTDDTNYFYTSQLNTNTGTADLPLCIISGAAVLLQSNSSHPLGMHMLLNEGLWFALQDHMIQLGVRVCLIVIEMYEECQS